MISIQKVQHRFPLPDGTVRHALDGVSLEVGEGEFVAIVGPSGCGKTTVLNLVAGLEQVQDGAVTVDGTVPRPGNARMGYMLAHDCLLPWRTALGNAELALEAQQVPKRERRARAAEALRSVGLGGALRAFPAQLSHGMRQRVALARVFAARPQIVLLDEPFSALDAQSRILAQDAFLEVWGRQSSTVMLITHDLSEAVCLADRVIVMSASPGRVKATHRVELPRPRSAMALRSTPAFHEIYDLLWNDLRDEVTRAAEEDLVASQRRG